MVAPPTEAHAFHHLSDPSLACTRAQVRGIIVPQRVWVPAGTQTPALFPQDFLFRVQRPGPPSAGGPTMSMGPLTLKEAERPEVVRMHILDDACADHLPSGITLVVQWPGRAPFCASTPLPSYTRAWSLAVLAREISVLMRGWLQSQGQDAQAQDNFLRAVYLVQCREVATNVWQPVFSWTGVPVKRKPAPGAPPLPPPNNRRLQR